MSKSASAVERVHDRALRSANNEGPILEVRDVHLSFGGVVALGGLTFSIDRAQVLGLIGPNGAGKTSLFNCLNRLYVPTSGEILFDGRSILSMSGYRMAPLGIGRTFQNLAMFPTMTVVESVMVGGHCRSRSDFLSDALRLPWVNAEERRLRARTLELLHYLDLDAHAFTRVSTLPFGTQKRVELARALATEPRLLLLDEPAGGLNHEEIDKLAALIRRIRDDFELAILLVEHHMGLVMAVSDRVVVINFGRKLAEGKPSEVRNDPEVVRAYLGTSSQGEH